MKQVLTICWCVHPMSEAGRYLHAKPKWVNSEIRCLGVSVDTGALIVSHVIACCVTWNCIIRSRVFGLSYTSTEQRVSLCIYMFTVHDAMVGETSKVFWIHSALGKENAAHWPASMCANASKAFFPGHVMSGQFLRIWHRHGITVHQYAGCHPTKSG